MSSLRVSYCLFLVIAVVCCSCGYQLGQGYLPSKYCTISIPYAAGDTTGELTATLIREVSRSGGLRYSTHSPELVLAVTIIDYCEENIGFRYDMNKDNKRIDPIIPIEARITVFAEVIVTETCSGAIVLGPARLEASVDFDHDYYYSPNGINTISLGQLTDYDVAYDDVQHPLNEALAKKIVYYLTHSW
ncbi:MAG: hypothetical protein WB791_03715 [Waddliaceae bacterium]